MIYRVRIKDVDGNNVIVDQTHSQLSETLGDIKRGEFSRFLQGDSIESADGKRNVKFVRYV